MSSNNQTSIPGMTVDDKYSNKKPIIPKGPENVSKDTDKTKKELEKFKGVLVKKYPYIRSISLLPPQSIPAFIEEEEIPKETEKYLQMYIIVPEEKFKTIPKIKTEIIKELEKFQKSLKQKVWIQIKTPIDIWEMCTDSKFELTSAIAMSFPLYDKGILQSLRVAEIHKSLVLQKFEKYVVSYVIAGSLVRGDVTKTSDVDVFIIINDTDVKRMPRLELKERLRSIIFQYISEACALAGVKTNILNVQPYLLTDFWEAVKDAHPVMFTFIRDGVPLYDRGTFMPWKALLKMGKLKPSPEAIDMFMSMGDNTVKRAKKALLDIVIHDIYWSVLTPSQALMMLHGLPPSAPKYVVSEMTDAFCKKDKMLEKKYIDILSKIVGIYKDYEHEKVKEITGTEVDKLLNDVEIYLKRLKELREQIEKHTQDKTIEDIYKDVFELLYAIFGKKPQNILLHKFEEELVKTGKLTGHHLRILKNIIDARTKLKRNKSNPHKINQARKEATILINDLVEFIQRRDLVALEKGKMQLKYKKGKENKTAELLICNGVGFLFLNNKIKKITNKIQDSNTQEVTQAIEHRKKKGCVEINAGIFDLVKKEIGEFEIVM